MFDTTKRDWPGDYLCCRDGINLVPVAHDQLPVGLLHEAWRRTEEDGLTERVFQRTMTWEQFAAYFANPATHSLLIFEHRNLQGYCWLNGVAEHRAFLHFCLFKPVWGRSEIFGQHAIDYWFACPGTDGPLLRVLIGSVPVRNRLALRLSKRLGFRYLGEIPYMAGDQACEVGYRLRDDLMNDEVNNGR